jgi:hypothetical protein
MTVVVRYHTQSASTFMLLKYRSTNSLPLERQNELVDRLITLMEHSSTSKLASDPFALFLFHFTFMIECYSETARGPRNDVRREEKKMRGNQKTLPDLNLGALHLTLWGLDQDQLEMAFILDLVTKLRKLHDVFYRVIKDQPDPFKRHWLYVRVEEELDWFENQTTYLKSSAEAVASRAQRLIDLVSRRKPYRP